MDTPAPAIVDEDDLLARLAAGWPIRVDSVRYVPKGAGSYHWVGETRGHPTCFVTVDDLDTKPWIASQRTRTFEGLRIAYETAWRLQHAVGLMLVVGPIRRHDGAVIVRLFDQFTMTVFPFVSGTAGTWGDPLLPESRSALVRDLARLHRSAGDWEASPPRRLPDLPERPLLAAALETLETPWHGGPFSEPARRALSDHTEDVTSWLAELDTLASRLRAAGGTPVLTHGEPHPGNLIHTRQGLRLVDWDTVALAAPERDLWMLDDGSPDAFGSYGEMTGTPINDRAIAFYRLAWTLSDIAAFADMFRSPHDKTRWISQKWDGFLRLLGGAPSEPYRFVQSGDRA